jgi:hypothetical protein
MFSQLISPRIIINEKYSLTLQFLFACHSIFVLKTGILPINTLASRADSLGWMKGGHE